LELLLFHGLNRIYYYYYTQLIRLNSSRNGRQTSLYRTSKRWNCENHPEPTDTDARVLIIEGAGDRSFCAGEDLKQTLAPETGPATELRNEFLQLQDITRLTSSSGVVVISAVQGFAIGGGAEIALAADFVIGGPGVKFKFPEVTLGHAVTGGISLRLVPIVGLLKAKELLLTGRWVGAEGALRLGMLNEICDDPKQRALELALELAKLPAIAMISSKTSLERAIFTSLEACLQDEVNVANYCFAQGPCHDAEQHWDGTFLASDKPSRSCVGTHQYRVEVGNSQTCR
jgi:enoyl-CoA hydratase/carnithine racemase